jgi:thioredoxin-like negative regulator of GroEL
VDEEPEISQKYGIRGIPCFILVEDGSQVSKKVGMQSIDQLLDLVK